MASPTDVTGGLVWLRSDSGVWQDSGMLTGCTNNTKVYTWQNMTGSLHASESLTGFQPTFVTSGYNGTLPTLQFRNDNNLTVFCSYNDPLSIFMVGAYQAIGNGSFSMWMCDSGATWHQVTQASASVQPYLYDGVANNFPSTVQAGAMKMLSIITTPGTLSGALRMNQVQANYTSTQKPLNGFQIFNGTAHVNNYWMAGDAYEILIYNRALTSGEILTVESYLTGKYPMVMPSGFEKTVVSNSTVSNANSLHISHSLPMSGQLVDPVKGLHFGNQTDSFYNDNTYAGVLRTNITENFIDGSPAPPCLSVGDGWASTFATFRWVISSLGSTSLSVNVKQSSNVSPRPSIVIKKNASMGIFQDIVTTAGSSFGWIIVGPITVNPTSVGVLQVELWNNSYGNRLNGPVLFDNITIT